MDAPPSQSAARRALPGVRRVFVTRAVSFALAALAVSCGDNVMGPTATKPISAVPPAIRSDIVVMERSTFIAAHDGIAEVRRTSTHAITGQLRASRRGTQQPQLSTVRTPTTAQVQVDPQPPISLPARHEEAMCSALPVWRETTRTGSRGTVDVAGLGDAPASSMRIVQDDGSVTTIERTWVRTANTWQLSRQVTARADGSYRDEVTYRHQTTTGQRVDAALPVGACVAPLGPIVLAPHVASRGYYAPHSASMASLSSPFDGTATSADCNGGGGGLDDCYYKQIAIYRAEIAVAVAAVAVGIACGTPAVIVVAPCVAAGTALAAAVALAVLAELEWEHCIRQPPLPVTLRIPTASSTVGSSRVQSLLGGGLGTADRLEPGAVLADCAGGNCGWEDWEISYDGGESWHYFTSLWVCAAE